MGLINLGGFTQIDGKQVSNGLASGLDTEGIISSLVAVRQLPIDSLESNKSSTDSAITALGTLENLLKDVQSNASILSNPAGVNNEVNNIFEYRNTFLTSSSSDVASDYMGVLASPGATIGKYDISIQNVATFELHQSDAQTSKTDALATSDSTLTITDDSGSPATLATINIEDDDSLEQIVARINAKTSETGVVADIVQVSDTDFRLSLSSNSTGDDSGFLLNFSDATLGTALDLESAAGQVTDAVDASITVNGVAGITRSSNTVTDIIDGMTFSLFKATETSQTVTVEVEQNQQLVADAVQAFVTSYNAFREFAAEQQERDENGLYADSAVLKNNTTLSRVISLMTSELNNSVAGITDGDPNKLNDLGLTFVDGTKDITVTDDDGVTETRTINVFSKLSFDSTTFLSELAADAGKVRKVFEFQLNSDGAKIASLARGNSIKDPSFSIDMDYTGSITQSAATITYTDPDSTIANSDDIDDTAMFGSSDSATAFSTGVTDGDRFQMTLTNSSGTATNKILTYRTTPTESNEFNSLDTLATAITNASGSTATVTNGILTITPTTGSDTMTFSDLDTMAFTSTFNLTSTNERTVYVDYSPTNTSSETDDITETAMFGSSDATTEFSTGVTNGHQFNITVNQPDGATRVLSFTYATTPSLSDEFDSLETLNNAINNAAGVTSTLSGGVLNVRPSNPYDYMTFSDVDATTFVATLGFSDTEIKGGIVNVDTTTSIEASTGNDITDTAIFGSSTSAAAFSSGIAASDSVTITLTDEDGEDTAHTFTYQASPTDATEFNSLDTLAEAIRGRVGLNAAIEDNKLVIIALDRSSTLSFANGTGVGQTADFVTDIGLTATVAGTETTNTDYAGTSLIYAGDGTDAAINVVITQGIADRVTNISELFTTDNIGLVDLAVTSLNEKNDKVDDTIERLTDQLDRYRTQLLNQFAVLEQAVSAANNIILLLDAQEAARNNG